MSKVSKIFKIVLTLSLLSISYTQAVTLGTSPIGFAAQNGGTTGGKGGTEHTVTTGDEINALLKKGASKLIIYVNGTITPSNTKSDSRVLVKEVSNISIIGSGTKGVLNGIGIKINKSSNIIIQNLAIHHVQKNTGDGDAIIIEGASGSDTKNIWVDHCELYNDLDNGKEYYDGLLDIKKECEYVTASWLYIHDSYKTSLIGYTDTDDLDRKITYHNNFFYNCNSRVPSIRGGTAHIFNNYLLDIPTSGVNCRQGAKVRVEGNIFENVKEPITFLDSDKTGYWDVGSGNRFTNCTGSQPATSSTTFKPPYDYTLASLDNVKSTVLGNVGYMGTKINISTSINTPDIQSTTSAIRAAVLLKNGSLTFSTSNAGNTLIELYNLSGRKAASLSYNLNAGSHSIPISSLSAGLPKGVYVIKTTLNGVCHFVSLPITRK